MGKPAGKVMPRPRGAYNESETYKILDMVTLDNKLWIAKKSGITGITPSKTTTEWMMAVDGTTDVKALETEVEAKFASIDEQFLAKDTQISGLDGRVTAAEGTIEELNGKFVFDSKPTKDSTNLMSSGVIYNAFNKEEKTFLTDNVSYQIDKSNISVVTQNALLSSNSEMYFGPEFLGGSSVRHIKKNGYVRASQGDIAMYSARSPMGDNTDTAYAKENSLFVTVDHSTFTMDFSESGVDATYLKFKRTSMYTQDSGTYDIGTSDSKFKDIYASNGVIQTSDSTEKKDIADLDTQIVTDIVMGLRPVSFKFINGTSDRTHYGLVAQEVEETINGLGISNKDFAPLIKTQKIDEDENPIEGEYVYGLRYAEFVGLLIKMCQNLQNEVDELKTRLGGA